MKSAFQQLNRSALIGLAEAISSDRLRLPCQPLTLASYVPILLIPVVQSDLNRLTAEGMKPDHIVYMLQLLANERKQTQNQHDAIDLVWTGEEVLGSESRDTSVVVQELFKSATKNVLISSYAVDIGSKSYQLFQPLAEQMEKYPNLSVRMFLNVKRPHHNKDSNATILRQFAETFRNQVWAGKRLPEVLYDPRSLAKTIGPKACLHAKCIVVDSEKLFITSANFTEAAHQRNIEAGILVSDRTMAKAMQAQFEMLASRRILQRIPGL
jgi:phosphatidylserine/phosphatidylglycerophosphate/cardiolipin synthase-like enzyme